MEETYFFRVEKTAVSSAVFSTSEETCEPCSSKQNTLRTEKPNNSKLKKTSIKQKTKKPAEEFELDLQNRYSSLESEDSETEGMDHDHDPPDSSPEASPSATERKHKQKS